MQAAAYAVEWDNSDRMMQESAERTLAILGPGKDPFYVGNDRKRVDINVFHDRAGHLSESSLKQSCLLYTSPSPRDLSTSRMPSSA